MGCLRPLIFSAGRQPDEFQRKERCRAEARLPPRQARRYKGAIKRAGRTPFAIILSVNRPVCRQALRKTGRRRYLRRCQVFVVGAVRHGGSSTCRAPTESATTN
jgi:hypothetical protein